MLQKGRSQSGEVPQVLVAAKTNSQDGLEHTMICEHGLLFTTLSCTCNATKRFWKSQTEQMHDWQLDHFHQVCKHNTELVHYAQIHWRVLCSCGYDSTPVDEEMGRELFDKHAQLCICPDNLIKKRRNEGAGD